MAEQLVRKLGYDCGRFRLSASPIINIAHRAKKLDEIARRFIARHPETRHHRPPLPLLAAVQARASCQRASSAMSRRAAASSGPTLAAWRRAAA